MVRVSMCNFSCSSVFSTSAVSDFRFMKYLHMRVFALTAGNATEYRLISYYSIYSSLFHLLNVLEFVFKRRTDRVTPQTWQWHAIMCDKIYIFPSRPFSLTVLWSDSVWHVRVLTLCRAVCCPFDFLSTWSEQRRKCEGKARDECACRDRNTLR